MLPYAGGSAYGSRTNWKRKGALGANAVTIAAAVVAVIGLAFGIYSSSRASAALRARADTAKELDGLRAEFYSLKSKLANRNSDYEHLEVNHAHAQRRLTEVSSQLQRKEAELVQKEQALHATNTERAVMEQHRNARESELTAMVEDLRKELLRSDSVVSALEAKAAQMSKMHAGREQDWHNLANTWINYEKELTDAHKKCLDEVQRLNSTAPPIPTLPHLDLAAEPKVRPETDFDHINVEVPQHEAHKFEPLKPFSPPPVPAQAVPSPQPQTGAASGAAVPGASPGAGVPAPGANTPAAAGTQSLSPSPSPTGAVNSALDQAGKAIRDQIAAMTAGGVPSPSPGTPSTLVHGPPSPNPVNHHDIYHADFEHHDWHDEHGEYHGDHYHDPYHGHYDHYDPMDHYWLQDAHGDWNADEGQHHEEHHGGHHEDPHGGKHHHHEAVGAGTLHHPGMDHGHHDPHAHDRRHHAQHQQRLQQQQQQQHPQQSQQQQQQQHQQQQHNAHAPIHGHREGRHGPLGDLAHKLGGW